MTASVRLFVLSSVFFGVVCSTEATTWEEAASAFRNEDYRTAACCSKRSPVKTPHMLHLTHGSAGADTGWATARVPLRRWRRPAL
jgi:hypothetical protein